MLPSLRETSMHLLRFALLPLVLSATPALAKEDYLALVARLTGGLMDGGQTITGSLRTGDVKMIAPGTFEVTYKSGVATFLYDEPDTCHFTQHSQMANQPTAEARLDFTLVTSIEVRDQGQWEGLNAALVTLNGPPETLQVLLNDAFVNQQPAFAFLASSIANGDASTP